MDGTDRAMQVDSSAVPDVQAQGCERAARKACSPTRKRSPLVSVYFENNKLSTFPKCGEGFALPGLEPQRRSAPGPLQGGRGPEPAKGRTQVTVGHVLPTPEGTAAKGRRAGP